MPATSIFTRINSSISRIMCVVASALLFATACSNTTVKPQKQTVKADVAIKIDDPVLRRITAVTDRFELEASGKFKGGTFAVRDKTLKFQPGTTFKLKLTLPITDPSVISTKYATGELITSAPIAVGGIPAPEKLVLEKGKVSGELDLVRTIGIFIFNVLEDQNVNSEGGGDWKDALDQLQIVRSSLHMRPGSTLDLGKQHVHVGKDSSLTFENLIVDSAFNYTGKCVLDVNFEKDCTYHGEKIDIDFNGGEMLVNFDATRSNRVVTLEAPANQKKIKLLGCVYRFGKDKKSEAKADTVLLSEKKFVWQKTEGTDKPAIHFASDMTLQKTVLHIQNTKLDLLANFPTSVPAILNINREEDGLMHTDFNTPKLVPAATADITLHRANEVVNVKLQDALVGPIDLTKFGDLQLSLANGVAKLQEISWGTDKHGFKLDTSGGSTVEITKGMSMDFVKGQSGMTFVLPMTLKLGNAKLHGSAMRLGLSKLNGSMVLKVDKAVDLDGKINFSIAESNLFGSNRADVTVNGLDITSANGESDVKLKNCSVVLPVEALKDEIDAHLPEDKVYPINKVMLAERKWRYKNAFVESISLKDPRLEKVDIVSPGVAKFTVSGDAEAKGTIEKGGILSVVKGPAKWEKRPWSASARLTGTGTVEYQILAHNALNDTELKYGVKMDLPLPEDIDLDWSKVNDGLLQGAERKAVVHSIASLKPLHLEFLDKSVKLFPNGAKNFKNLKLKNLKTHPVASGMQLDFNADAVF
ncbi:MAG TPA: hypothetical protein V6C76_11185 [Drouetiella sp.]